MLVVESLPPTPETVKFSPHTLVRLEEIRVYDSQVDLFIGLDADYLRSVGRHVGGFLMANNAIREPEAHEDIDSFVEALCSDWDTVTKRHFAAHIIGGVKEERNATQAQGVKV